MNKKNRRRARGRPKSKKASEMTSFQKPLKNKNNSSNGNHLSTDSEYNQSPPFPFTLWHCFSCNRLTPSPRGFGVFYKPGAVPVRYALCGDCSGKPFLIPPPAQRKFFENIERNLDRARGGNNG